MAGVESDTTDIDSEDGGLGSHHNGQQSRILNGSYIMACGLEDEGSGNGSENSEKRCQEEGCNHFYDNPMAVDESVSNSASYKNSDERLANWINSASQMENGTTDDSDRPLPAPANISDGIPLCRICHEDDADEDLVSPCFCSGSVGLLHMSCLEMWLGTSDSTKCEICQFQFTIQKKPRPFKWFLTNRRLGSERRYMIADFICCLFFLPCTVASAIACLVGATYFSSASTSWQGTGLILLATVNICVFGIWSGLAFRRNYKLFRRWRGTYQTIKIRYNPPNKLSNVNSNSKIIATEVMELDPQPRVSCVVETDGTNPKTKTTTIYGTPWPKKKTYLASTPRVETIPMNKMETSTPMNIIHTQLMRKWGLHGCPNETPIPAEPRPRSIPIDFADSSRVKHSFREIHDEDDSGMVCMSSTLHSPSTPMRPADNVRHSLFLKKHDNPVTPPTYPKYEISAGIEV